jgi:putative alpha-1,2-mannosidase
MISSEQACSNAEAEIPNVNSGWDWDAVQGASNSQWESLLGRLTIDTANENSTLVELLYSSLYRTLLVPANLTGENPYWDNQEPFYDALFCSWDTFRTVHPWLSIIAPVEWAEIVRTYVDGWRNTGYIPECRANTKASVISSLLKSRLYTVLRGQ